MSIQNGQTLPLVNVITVTVLPTPATLGMPIINTVALFTSDQPSGWADGQTYGVYKDPAPVATDFGVNSNAYAMAVKFFAQTPNPIGTGGYLVVIPLLPGGGGESVRAAIVRIGNSVFYYGVLIDNELAASDGAEFALLVAALQAAGKLFGYASSNVNDLQPGSPLDIIRQESEYRGRMFYYGTALLNGAAVQQTQMFAAAYLGRGLSVDFTGVGTAITMHGKQLVGIVPDQTVGQTQLNLALTAGIDVYVSIAGVPAVFCSGANKWFDEVYNDDWFASALQVAGFNFLLPINFKIPQTEEGMSGLKDAYRGICEQAKAAGVIAPGAWTGAVPAGVPQALFRSNIANVGYFVFSQPVALQAPADRVARKAPLVQIAAKLAGAIQSSDVLVQMQP
ncbi:MAG: DUF3383 family protein [bacterium]